jgi:hypothetical protein
MRTQISYRILSPLDRRLCVEALDSGSGSGVMAELRRAPNAMTSGLRSLEVNQLCSAETPAVLVFYNVEMGAFDLCVGNNPPMQGHGQAVAFVTRNK